MKKLITSFFILISFGNNIYCQIIRERRTYTVSKEPSFSINENESYVLLSRGIYNSQNNNILSVLYFPNGNLKGMIVYEYDLNKKLFSYMIFDSVGKMIGNIEKNYTSDGQPLPIVFNIDIDWECRNRDPDYKTNCLYNKNGDIIFFEKSDNRGNVIEKYKYEYDYN